ncbi:MAG TPA: HAMP domain-containing sensor histidine kinase [Sphingomicrobium sp.]|nr:HAMP domain-containing sensor histidine kinase [Sphingomicrobium sp.]
MASAAPERPPILGRVDSTGRLVEADPQLAALQAEAGSRVGSVLAIPQLAAIVRMARNLRVPVTRPAIAASEKRDIDLVVNAIPEGSDIRLVIEGWNERVPSGPRLAPLYGSVAESDSVEPELHWAVDDQLRLVALSPELAERLGLDLGEVIGQPLTRILRLEEDESGEMPLLAGLAGRQGFSGQRISARTGGSAVFRLSGETVLDREGSFAGFEGRAEPLDGAPTGAPADAFPPSAIDQALDEALRSPIDRIIQCADRIIERGDGPLRSDYAAYAADISTAARHLLSVIRSMREEPGDGGATVDLAALAAEAVIMLESSAEGRGVAIHMELSRSLPARGDERGVIQILVNLIGNAVRHSPAGSTVSLSFRSDQERASAIVADEGPGIEPADHERIFERFERAGSSDDGTGLGLAIARRLARSMGGDITLDSRPGQGARFTLTLPRA